MSESARARLTRRLVASSVTALLTVTLAEASQVAPASAAPVRVGAATAAASVAAPKQPATSADDTTSALSLARLTKHRIEDTSQRAETSTTWAEPDGTFTTEVHQSPVRYKDAQGAWRQVDLTLAGAAGGRITPRGHRNGLSFAGQAVAAPGKGKRGTARLVDIDAGRGRSGSRAVGLGWNGAVPAAVAQGEAATYPSIEPGTDLRFEARRNGFEQYVVLNSRPATAPSWDVPLNLTGVTPRADADGGVSFVDAAGEVASRFLPATAWDAVVDPRSGEPANTSRVTLTPHETAPGQWSMTITPDAAWLMDPARAFPVTVDPTYQALAKILPSFDAFVQNGFTSDQSGATELKVGTYDGGADVARSFLNFPTAGFRGLKVMGATLSLYETHSFSCSARAVYVRQTSTLATTSTRWTAQPAVGSTETTASFAKGYSTSCNDGWVSLPVTPFVQAMSTSTATTGGLRLHASETDSYGWKRFASSETTTDPYLTVTYDRAPSTPTAVAWSSPSPVGSWLRSKTPTLQATVADPDGNQTRAIFEVWKGTTKVYGPLTGSLVSSGSISRYTLPSTSALVEGSAYTIRAYGKDEVGLQSAAYASSAVVTIDVTPTGTPIVSSTDYPNDSLYYGAAGTPGTFTFSSPAGTADLVKYYWGLDVAPTSTQVVTPTTGTTGTVKITPATAGRHVLQVQGVDRAGNLSTVLSYVFNVGRAGVLQPLDGGRFARRVPLALQVLDPSLTHAVFEYRRGAGAAWTPVPLGHLTAANNSALGSRVQLSAIGGSLSWDAVATLGINGGTVDVRAQLYGSATATTALLATDLVQVTVDLSADGAASDDIGPGSVNLLTGDYSVDTDDVSEFGIDVSRASSSRDPGVGWTEQGEHVPAATAAGSTLTGIAINARATATLVTTRGAEGSTDSFQVAPAATGTASNDTFVSVDGDTGAFRSGLRAGHRYRASGWIYVPAATGVSGVNATRGLRVVAFWKDSGGVYREAASPAATAADVDSWRQLSVDFTVPAGATEAFVRLYNGFAVPTSSKTVLWDDLSIVELTAPFGPAWTGGADNDLTSDGYASLRLPTAYSAELVDVDGGVTRFTRTKDNTTFVPEPGAEDLTLRATADGFVVSDTDGTSTYLTLAKDAAGASTGLYLTSKVVPAQTAATTQYEYDVDYANKTSRVSRVVNPVEAGIDPASCVVPAPTAPGRGCEVLEYVYATATTATATSLGDVFGQVKGVKVWSTIPDGTTTSAVDVAAYAYDTTGQLREVWDPRATAMGKPALKTTYTYDAAGRLAGAAAPGESGWTFTYSAVGSDPNAGRVTTVAQGTNKTTIVYGVPLTKSAGGPHDMAAADVAAWAQTDVPTDATAVFPPMAPATVPSASSTVPGSGGYGSASLHYLDAAGRETNTATPAPAGTPAIDTDEFDRYGNTVRRLDATNRLTALGQGPDTARWLDELGLTDATTAVRAQALDTTTRYTKDGLDVLESTGPVRAAVLEETLADPDGTGPLAAITAGTTVVARPHTTTAYDEGKPDAAVYHLPTTQREGARLYGYDPAYPDADVREIRTGYAPAIGGTSGWTLQQATSTTVDPSGSNLTSTVRYDDAGRAVESRKVDSAGGDVRTNRTVFWTAGTNPDATYGAQCGGRPEWAGSPCVTYVAGTVPVVALPGGGTSSAPAELPVKQVLRYSRTGDAEIVKETANGEWRQTQTSYDLADRITRVVVTGSAGAGAAVDTVNSTYNDATGDLEDTYTTDPTTGAETGRIHRGYDGEGRLSSYTDADGGTTSTTFDTYGRPNVVSSSMAVGGATVDMGSSTYSYDTAKDPRGVVTGITDSVAGTFGAAYGADGQVVQQTFPGGITQATTYDSSGSAVERTYTAADGTLVYSDSVVESIHGQWVSQSYNGETRRYRYDRMGRLVGTASSVPGTGDCVTRSYAYDNRANRKARSTTPGVISDTDGTCVASTDPAATTTENHTYDSADRLVDPGVVYDAFGRTTALPTTDAGTPATLQNSYYVNDLVASQTLGTHRQSWTLDPGMRLRSFATQAQTAGVWSNASAKVNHYDGDDDESRWIVEDTSQGAQAPVTRNVESVDGSLAATTAATAAAGDVQLQLVNLHGDVAVTLASDLSVQSSRFFDEFGAPESGTASGTGKDRYGWLGGAQRSGEALGDVLLMGVRLYSPLLGRFLQTDPVPDGNASAYDYCNADPVNCTDLDGRWGWKKLFHAVARVSEYASWIPGPIGTAAAAVSSVSYYASGNRRKALEMGLTAAANLVGAGAGVRAGFRVARYAAKAGRIRRFASRASRVTRCNSFTPDTLVVAGDGTLVPIDQLAPGDDVATVDPATGDFVPKPVLDVITGYGTKHLIEVTVDTTTSDGTTTGVFTATDEHPVWVDGHGWVHADALTAGMRTSGTTGGISVVRLVHDLGWLSGQTVYNLNVGDAHTYLVADPTGTDTLVHNSSCPIFKHHVPNKRGVYVIHFKNGERYVGRSKYMHKRVHQHFARRGKFHGRGYSDISHIESYTHHTARYTRYQEQMWINHHRRSGLLLNRRNEWARFVR